MKRMMMHKASSSDDDASLEERVFAQTFVSDDDDVRLFACAKDEERTETAQHGKS